MVCWPPCLAQLACCFVSPSCPLLSRQLSSPPCSLCGAGPGPPQTSLARWLPVGLARVGAQGRLRQVGERDPPLLLGPICYTSP